MGAIESIIKGAEYLRKADKIEEYKQILELLEERPKYLEQISALKEENNILKAKLKKVEDVKKGIECYLDKEGTRYCMHCFDKNHDLIRLKSRGRRLSMECPECKNYFNTTGAEDEALIFRSRYDNHI